MTDADRTARARYVGARVHRVEDARLLTGHGTYVDDIVAARACCTPASCAARSPAPRSAAIDTVGGAGRCPGVHFVFTAADLNPGVKEQWHTLDRAAEPRDAAPAARRRRGPLRRRPGRARRRRRAATSPRTRPSSSTSTTSRCRPSSTTPTAEHADALVHESHGSNVIGELAGLPASALDDVFAVGRPRGERDDPPAGVRRRCRWKDAAWSSTTRARPASSRSTRPRSRRTRCACSARACSACPSTASASSCATPAAASGRRSWSSATRCA